MTRPSHLPDRTRPALRRRRGRVAAAVVTVLALCIGGTDVFLLTQARTSTAVGLDSVLEEFRQANGTPAADASTADADAPGIDPTAPSGAAAPDTADTAGDPGTTEPDVSQTAAPDAGQPAAPEPTTSNAPGGTATAAPTSPEPAGPTLSLPAPGVYEYATKGQETVSLGGARHDYPETTYASVRHDGGCDYTVEHRWVEEHVERHHRCNQGTDLLAKAFDADITFFGQQEHSALTCTPPQLVLRLGDAPGTMRESTCTGEDTTTYEKVTYLGEEPIVIGGVEVMAKHIMSESRVEGRSNGGGTHEKWLHPENGATLRGIRHVDTMSQAFGSEVRYVEDVDYTLVSLTPRT